MQAPWIAHRARVHDTSRRDSGMGPGNLLQTLDRTLSAHYRAPDTPFPIDGRCGMEFVDRLLTCVDCGGQFVFTAGEQLFFWDKQFKNDPKRCKPCKSRRSAVASGASTGTGPAPAGISRIETRTECSECGVSTTVPFKPTQGRPVLCRQCFKNKRAAAAPAAKTDTVATSVPSAPAASAGVPTGAAPTLVAAAIAAASEPVAELVAQPSSAA